MHDSDKDCCKLCGAKTLPVYGYPHDIPEVIPFKTFYDWEWHDVELYICPKCGSVFGKVDDELR